MQITLVCFVQAFVVAIWAKTFFEILPSPAKSELSLELEVEDEEGSDASKSPPPAATRLRLDKQLVLQGLILVLAVFSTFYSIEKSLEGRRMPESVISSVTEAKLTPEKLVLQLRIEDYSHGFRWLEESAFKVAYQIQEKSQSSKDLPTSGNRGLSRDNAKQLFSVIRVEVADEQGEQISIGNLSPRKGAVFLLLQFEKPKGFVGKDLEFALYYAPFSDTLREIYRGNVGDFW